MPVFKNSASRILSLALLTILINKQGWFGLLFLLLPLLILFYKYPPAGKQIFFLASRLRWFFVSILILYLWFYPGEDLIPLLGRFSPAVEGVDEAAQRITSLLLIISYSGFLLLLTPREEIIAGLKYLLSPLKLFGIDSSSFALRLGLVLAIVPQIKDQNIAGNHTITHKSISKVIDQAAEMIKQAADENQRYEVESILIAETPRPGFIEILVPVLLFVWLFCSFS